MVFVVFVVQCCDELQMDYYDEVKEAADAIRARVPSLPTVAIVLGSGLGDFASSLGGGVVMPYTDLPHWPASRVIGHEGKLVVGTVRGRTVAALAGRCHAYEGHDLRTVTFAVRPVACARAARRSSAPSSAFVRTHHTST